MEITIVKEGDTDIFLISGRIDTITHTQLSDKILQSFKKCKSLILDFEKVQYISSAGLRSLIIGHKTAVSKGGVMELRNVNPSVMSVLNTVGFSKMLNIK
ncbi:MAG: STAS domain-containing protein [Oscillospiraceae bacterium]|nr:STAS domain-containing protein [Oscillospiraceae bacterium]